MKDLIISVLYCVIMRIVSGSSMNAHKFSRMLIVKTKWCMIKTYCQTLEQPVDGISMTDELNLRNGFSRRGPNFHHVICINLGGARSYTVQLHHYLWLHHACH